VRASLGWKLPVGVAIALHLAEQAVGHGIFHDVLPPLGRRVVASIAAPICLGALLAYALRQPRGFAAAWALLGHPASAPLALLAVTAMLWVDGVPLVAVHLGLTLLVGACTIRSDHGLRALTDAAPVRFVGTVSYGMYLFHVSMVTLSKRVLPPAWSGTGWVFALAFALTLAAAAASHRWFEQPFLRLRDRLR